MDKKRYIELDHFQTLLELYRKRDCYNDWSTEWAKYNEKIQNTIAWLERNARPLEQIMEGKQNV